MLGEKLLIKLWETITEKGIGSLLSPWQILRESDARTEARRREIILLADAEKKAEDIKKGRIRLLDNGSSSLTLSNESKGSEPTLDMSKIIEHSEARKQSDHIREEINISKAIICAEEELVGDTQEPPDRSIDEDWLYKWKDNASKVSAEELQQLWGKLLAGELKSPGKYSLRTLEFLKNISQVEAHLIEKAAQFNISGCVSRDEEEILNKNGVTFSDLLFLQELGVVIGVEAIGMSVEYSSDIKTSFQKVLISNKKALLITHEDKNKKLTFNTYGLSSVGKQILSLGNFEFNMEYLISVGKRFAKNEFTVKLGDWLQIDEKHGKLSNAIDIENENA